MTLVNCKSIVVHKVYQQRCVRMDDMQQCVSVHVLSKTADVSKFRLCTSFSYTLGSFLYLSEV